jgi:hypothetical protein
MDRDTQIDRRSAVELLAEVERRFDVNSVLYKDLHLWPLVRLRLWQQLLNPRWGTSKTASQRHTSSPIDFVWRIKSLTQAFVSTYRQNVAQMTSLRAVEPVEFTFFSRAVEHADQVDDRFYNRFLDPLIDLVEEEHGFVKIELPSDKAQETMPRFRPAVFVDPEYYHVRERLARQVWPWHNIAKIDGLADLLDFGANLTDSEKIDRNKFIITVQRLDQYRSFFEDVLSVIEPKVVFLVCYYYPVAMALIWACRRLGIVSVDIQHGNQENHGLYARWTNVPKGGYDLLPDIFWVWGASAKDNICDWHLRGSQHNWPVVGGNLWLAKWLHGEYPIDARTEDFVDRLGLFEKVILFSLQWIDDPLPEHVLHTMRRSPSSWLWLIRLHPLQKQSQQEIHEIIEQYNIQSFEISQATHSPLYSLLKHCDHHITCWSTTGYEALAFGVPTTIVHPTGTQVYERYVKNGVFGVALDSDELLAHLHQASGQEKLSEAETYIETDPQIAEEALEVILEIYDGWRSSD